MVIQTIIELKIICFIDLNEKIENWKKNKKLYKIDSLYVFKEHR